MGCSTSKLDDEEAVQLCEDRKNFIRQAVEHRIKFASGHIAYIQAMKRVSAALREYVDGGDEPREFLLDSFSTPVKKSSPGVISIAPNSFSVTPLKSQRKASYKINYYRSGGNSTFSVEERPPQSPDTHRVEAYSPMQHYGMENVFGMQSNPMSSSFFEYSPNNNERSNFPPPSPQTSSQWDFFWNPFSSLDYYGYTNRESLDRGMMRDENDGLRQVREEEGIPELEEETEREEETDYGESKNDENKVSMDFDKEHVVVEDASDSDDDDDDTDVETDVGDDISEECFDRDIPASSGNRSKEVAKAQSAGQMSRKQTTVGGCESEEERTPGFTVYVNRRPTSMAEVIKDLEDQFMAACNAAGEMSSILEANRAQYSSSSNDLTAMKMLNPVALFRSASSRSSSSRFAISASTSRDESYESTSDFSEESSLFSGSHQSTLDRLYAWEKKLYQEVRAGERVRRAYEKKCAQLRNQDVKGEDPSFVDKTRTAIRDLHTQIKVSIHSVEAVCKRIETLRDEELEPQLIELVQGLAKMWKVMAECHQLQKRTLDEAKILLAGTPSKLSGARKKYTVMSASESHRLARSAANLENELRNWRSCFNSWIVSQRSYVQALKSWLLRCAQFDPDTSSRFPFSPRRVPVGAPPIFDVCIRWSVFIDAVPESPVLDGMDLLAEGVGSVHAHQRMRGEDPRRLSGGRKEGFGGEMEVAVDRGGGSEEDEEEVLTAEKMTEVAIGVVCAGMSVAVSAMTEYALSSAEGYGDLMKRLMNGSLKEMGK
ncbi:hypothetical protein OROMI_002246 [Orobanche minor]